VKSTNRKKAAILNSRQSLRPIGTDLWIINAGLAVRDAKSRGCAILASVGMSSWEIALYFASKYKADLSVYAPSNIGEKKEDIIDYWAAQFHLEKSRTEWHFIDGGKKRADYNRFRSERDNLVVSQADLIYPISLRPDGNLRRLIDAYGKPCICDFQTAYEARKGGACRSIEPSSVDDRVDLLLEGYIIHWTKASNFPWPGETHFQYYEDIVNSSRRYARSGLGTLKRILRERRLRASAKHVRKGFPAVAFSTLKPSLALGLMKWRARYREMTFEPYGVGIRKEYAERIGIRKVFYGSPEMYRYLEKEHQPYFQNIGTIGDWLAEMEYRHIGDLDLSLIPDDMIAVVVKTSEEVAEAKSIFPGKIIALCAR
jgi:hypothetical protein